jgi:hypothetical protein
MLKWKLLGALTVLTVGSVVSAVVLCEGTPRATEENFDRIRDGMTRAEVEAILGPPGDYHTEPVPFPGPCGFRLISIVKEMENKSCWKTDACYGSVTYGDAGRVENADYMASRWANESRFHSFRRLVERQWRKWFPE